jgi:hypothetical protein
MMDAEPVSRSRRVLVIIVVLLLLFMLMLLQIGLRVGQGGRIPIDYIMNVSNSSIVYK